MSLGRLLLDDFKKDFKPDAYDDAPAHLKAESFILIAMAGPQAEILFSGQDDEIGSYGDYQGAMKVAGHLTGAGGRVLGRSTGIHAGFPGSNRELARDAACGIGVTVAGARTGARAGLAQGVAVELVERPRRGAAWLAGAGSGRRKRGCSGVGWLG